MRILVHIGVLPPSWQGCDVRWLAPVPGPVHPFQGNPLQHNPRRELFAALGLARFGWNCASCCCSPCCSWDWCSPHSSSETHRSAGSTLSEDLDLLEGLLLSLCLTQCRECSLCCLLCFHCCSTCWQCCCLSFSDPAPLSPCPPWTSSLAPLSSSVSSLLLTSSSWSGRRLRWGRQRSLRQWRRPWWSRSGCLSAPLCYGWWWGSVGSPCSGGGSLQTVTHLRTGRCKTCSWKKEGIIKAHIDLEPYLDHKLIAGWPGRSILSTNYRPPLKSVSEQCTKKIF